MIPLNIYLHEGTPEQIEKAVVEYGNAIKDLVAANIFPGDMLWKNFGVTRHGKVVFYDYDEIEYITDCNFRRVPEPRTEEEEMSGEIWYARRPEGRVPRDLRPLPAGQPGGARGLHEAPRRPARRRFLAGCTRSASWPAMCTMSFPTSRTSVLATCARPPPPQLAERRVAGAAGAGLTQLARPWHQARASPGAGHRAIFAVDAIACTGQARDIGRASAASRPFREGAPHVRSHRHRLRRAHAHRRPARRLRRAGRLGTGCGGHPRRGAARRRAAGRRRRGADGQRADGRPGPGAGAPGRAEGRLCRCRPAPSR